LDSDDRRRPCPAGKDLERSHSPRRSNFSPSRGFRAAVLVIAQGGHNNFYIRGPGSCSAQVLITVGISLGDLKQAFGNVTQAAVVTCSYCVSGEDNLPVYVATNPLTSLHDLWPSVKHFN